MTDEELYQHIDSNSERIIEFSYGLWPYLFPDVRNTLDVGVRTKIAKNINPILGTLLAHYWSIETNEVEDDL
jgi:hypothetical protein